MPVPAMCGPEVKLTSRPVSLMANSASRRASACDFSSASFLLAVSAALLAALYPAWRLSRMQAAEALRGE